MNTSSSVGNRQFQLVGNTTKRSLCSSEIERHVATQEELGVKHAKSQVTVSHCSMSATASVTRWSGHGTS